MLFSEEDTVDRLCYLYSERNSEEKDTLCFWTKKIQLYCEVNRAFSFDLKNLPESFTTHGIYPSSLLKSFSILKRNEELFKNRDQIIFQKNDFQQLMFSSAMLITKNLFQYKQSNEFFICVKLFEKSASELQHYLKTLRDCECVVLLKAIHPQDKLYTLTSLLHKSALSSKEVSGFVSMLENISDENAALFANYLLVNRKAQLSEDGTVIKILKQKATAEASSPSRGILSGLWTVDLPCVEEGDTAVLRLRLSIVQLEERVTQLEHKASEHKRSALNYKKLNNEQLALFQLSLRRAALETRDKVALSLMNLTQAHEQIDSVEINRIITDAYKSAAVGLRSARVRSGVTVETAEEALEDFQTEMEEMNEISAVLEQGAATAGGVLSEEEEQALLDELEGLMASATLSESSEKQAAVSVPVAVKANVSIGNIAVKAENPVVDIMSHSSSPEAVVA